MHTLWPVSGWLPTAVGEQRADLQASIQHHHQLALSVRLHPTGTLMEPIFTGTPAKVYPFELDPFQKTSVACLVRGVQHRC